MADWSQKWVACSFAIQLHRHLLHVGLPLRLLNLPAKQGEAATMPSFTRRAPATAPAPPPGTHPSPSSASLNVLPTGLPSMDDLLGSGLPLGSVLLVLAPDHHSAWSRLVERYFLAKGLLSGQGVAMLGNEGEAREVLRGCMWVEGGTNMDEGGTAGQGAGGESGSEGELPAGGKGEQGEGRGGGKIAWRYEGMKKFRTTVDGQWLWV